MTLLQEPKLRSVRPAMLKATEVAEFLRISKDAVYRMSDDGTLPKPTRVGRRYLRWNNAELQEFLHLAEPISVNIKGAGDDD